MFRIIILLSISSLLIGCVTVNSSIRYATKANDDAVKGAKFVICRGASVGAIEREFDTEARKESRAVICKPKAVQFIH